MRGDDVTEDEVIEKIIEAKGDCLSATLCMRCPFSEICLPEFFREEPSPTRQERLDMALNYVVRKELLGDDEIGSIR